VLGRAARYAIGAVAGQVDGMRWFGVQGLQVGRAVRGI
jgi:hypothetical protein